MSSEPSQLAKWLLEWSLEVLQLASTWLIIGCASSLTVIAESHVVTINHLSNCIVIHVVDTVVHTQTNKDVVSKCSDDQEKLAPD